MQRENEKLVVIDGIGSKVTIKRDEFGIPHIYANDLKNALYGLGYAQGQDRLWQIDVTRRVASGTLSELFGSKGLDLDIFMRNIKVPWKAKKDIANLSQNDLILLSYFTKGINDAAKSKLLPIEYYLTWSHWEEFQEYHVYCVSYLMSLGLGSMWGNDLLLYELYKIIGEEAFFVLPSDEKIIKPISHIISESELPKELQNLNPVLFEDPVLPFLKDFEINPEIMINDQSSGSNAWVISGKFTKSGKPIFSNDPHLPSTAPSTWYLVHLHLPNNTISGSMNPGHPIIPTGRSNNLVWGTTSLKSDSIDLFVEKIQDNQYLYGDSLLPFTEFHENIVVKGQGPLKYTFQETIHGPVLNNPMIGGNKLSASLPISSNHTLAFAWSAYYSSDNLPDFLRNFVNAKTVFDIRESLEKLRITNAAILVASIDNEISFQSTGIIPIRKTKGNLPVPGWIPELNWQGIVPYEDMPYVINPPKGYIVMANNYVVQNNYKYFDAIGKYFSQGRAERISELIEEKIKSGSKFTAQDQVDFLQDELSIFARESVPKWLGMVRQNKKYVKEYEEMQKWDYVLDKNSVSASIYIIWVRNVQRNILKNHVNEENLVNYQKSLLSQLAVHLFFKESYPSISKLCDNPNTVSLEKCEDLVSESFFEACEEASGRPYGEIHNVKPEHTPFSKIAVINTLFNMKQPVGGAYHTVHAMQFAWPNDFTSKHGPGLKFVADLGNNEENYWAVETGQSGNPLSKHYMDMFYLFHTKKLIKWEFQDLGSNNHKEK